MFSYLSAVTSKLSRSKAVGHRACELHDTHSSPTSLFSDSRVTARNGEWTQQLAAQQSTSTRCAVANKGTRPMKSLKGAKRLVSRNMKNKGLISIPAIMGMMAMTLAIAMANSANAAGAVAAPGWAVDSVAVPTSFSAADNAECAVEGNGSCSSRGAIAIR